MIDPQIVEHLLPFYENPGRRTKTRKIPPHAPDLDIIATSNRLQITRRMARGKKTLGYIFTPLGNEFFRLLLQEKDLRKSIENLDHLLKTAEQDKLSIASQKPQISENTKVVIEAIANIGKDDWQELLVKTAGSKVDNKMRGLLIAYSKYRQLEKNK
jgi:hypothetical protein